MKRQKRIDIFWKQIFYPRMIFTAHELRATVISRIGMFTLTKTMCENIIYCIPVKFKGGVGTVGQEAVELICQSERKTPKNAKISLWPLYSTEMDLILMQVSKKS